MRYKQRHPMTGEELRAIRDRLQVSQMEFARLLGKHPITISQYERGKWVIPETVAKLARTLK